ncbi:hypothetical protein EJ04DRAFT_552673 [Polyplosphaeria fusca]|uniref:Uncharacterized protein n=1 Tax=Polyplosphaeria fusca TaxID=682080 RepID=A0A9P4V1H5_9PLEO|nr:hypothetical protein EJ04DRAFT_552673 [Polyplosphaeria fusca]
MSTDSHPPSTTTIPSEQPPTNDTDAISPPSAPPRQATKTLRLRLYLYRILLRASHRTDTFLTRLTTLLSSPTSTDALLCTLSYTLELLRSLLSQALLSRLNALSTATKTTPLVLPSETPIPSTTLLAQAVSSTKALAALLADFRVFVRLWGLLGIYAWGKAVWKAPTPAALSGKERVLRGLACAQILSCVAFQVLENGAYLASKGVLTGEGWAAREGAWWVWSSRFWAVHVGLEGVRLGVLWWASSKERGALGEKGEVGDGEKEGKMEREGRRREDWVWWRDVVSNAAYFPMTMHWSTATGLLSDAGVGALGAVAGGALLVDAWRQTA